MVADPRSRLLEQIRKGNVLLVSGTGVSIAASKSASEPQGSAFASWAGLLHSGLDRIERLPASNPDVVAAQRQLLTKGTTREFVLVAEWIVKEMGGHESPTYGSWLAETVGTVKTHDPRVPNALLALGRKCQAIATTNYDDVLLPVERERGAVTWMDPEFITVARGKRPGILYLHGHWERPRTVVLDWRSYDQRAEAGELRSDLEATWKMLTWVYVGCGPGGLGDPDLGLLLGRHSQRARNQGLWDFFLSRDEDAEALQREFDKRTLNIVVVPYGPGHEALAPFLEGLQQELAAEQPPTLGDDPTVWEPIDATFRWLRQAHEDPKVTLLPSWEEFIAGKVYRPHTVDEVKQRLDRNRLCWLRGTSGTGKSTIAYHLVIEAHRAGLRAAYLDMEDDDIDEQRAAVEMRRIAPRYHLFIVDNVHASPRRAETLLREWDRIGGDNRLLALGWPVSSAIERRHMVQYVPFAMEVGVSQEDVKGVFNTLFHRLHGPSATPPHLTDAVLKAWHTELGADLVALQCAVLEAIDSHRGFTQRLPQTLAVRRVWSWCLEKCSAEERLDLRLAALVGGLIGAVPIECMHSDLQHSHRMGLIRESRHGETGAHVRVRFWHVSLGKLILLASRPPMQDDEVLEEAVRRSPSLCGVLPHALLRLGRREVAVRLFGVGLREATSLSSVAGSTLNHTVGLFRLADRLDSRAELARLATRHADAPEVAELVVHTEPHFLSNFLAFIATREDLKPFENSLVQAANAEAEKGPGENRILARALDSGSHFLASFLRFPLGRADLRPLKDSFFAALNAEARKGPANRVLGRVLTAPLHFLVDLLDFVAGCPDLSPLYESLIAGLNGEGTQSASENRLLMRALTTDIHTLVNLLSFVSLHADLRPLERSLVSGLNAEAKRSAAENRLASQAPALESEVLMSLLAFLATRSDLRNVESTVIAALKAEAAIHGPENRLVSRATTTDIGHLGALLKFLRARPELHEIYRLLVTRLNAAAAKEGETALKEGARRADLGHLLTFMADEALIADLPSVYALLIASLTADCSGDLSTSPLIDRSIRENPGKLAAFIELVQSRPEMQPIHVALRRALGDNGLTQTQYEIWNEHLAQAEVGDVASLLAALDDPSACVRVERLLGGIGSEFSARVRVAPPGPMARVFRVLPALAVSAVQSVQSAEWASTYAATWFKSHKSTAIGLGFLLVQLAKNRLAEHAAALADRIVETAAWDHWRGRHTQLLDLATVLHFSHASGPKRKRFLDACIRGSWLRNRYYHHELNRLLGGVGFVVSRGDQWLHRQFCGGPLGQRVAKELSRLPGSGLADSIAILSIWCMATIARLHLPLSSSDSLRGIDWSAIACWGAEAALPPSTHLPAASRWRWMSLLFASTAIGRVIVVPRSCVESALARYRFHINAQDQSLMELRWSKAMVQWLEACERDGKLSPDRSARDQCLWVPS